MSAWKTIAIVGATLALAAPAANASFDRSLPPHAKSAKKVSHHRVAPLKGANIGVTARLGEGWEDRGHGLFFPLSRFSVFARCAGS
jgi:hypothetical protein